MWRWFGWVLLGIVIVAIGISAYVFYGRNSDKNIIDFESCAKKYPVMETYPEQCRTKDGRTFTKSYPTIEFRFEALRRFVYIGHLGIIKMVAIRNIKGGKNVPLYHCTLGY